MEIWLLYAWHVLGWVLIEPCLHGEHFQLKHHLLISCTFCCWPTWRCEMPWDLYKLCRVWYMLEGALAKILTQAMLTWGRFAAWTFNEASTIKKLCKWLIKSCGECPFVCYLVIGMMDSLPWSSGGKDYSLEGARNTSAHFAWAVCILGRIPWVQIWVACGTCRSLSKGHEIFIMKLVIHIMGIFTFTLTQQKMPGTPLLGYRWHELHISKLLYFTSSTLLCLIQRFSTYISLLTFYFFESPHTWKKYKYDSMTKVRTIHNALSLALKFA